MRFFDLDVKALKGLTIEFETDLPHQPYTEKGNRWALVQRHEKAKVKKIFLSDKIYIKKKDVEDADHLLSLYL